MPFVASPPICAAHGYLHVFVGPVPTPTPPPLPLPCVTSSSLSHYVALITFDTDAPLYLFSSNITVSAHARCRRLIVCDHVTLLPAGASTTVRPMPLPLSLIFTNDDTLQCGRHR